MKRKIYAPVTEFERATNYCPLYLARRILDEARDYFWTSWVPSPGSATLTRSRPLTRPSRAFASQIPFTASQAAQVSHQMGEGLPGGARLPTSRLARTLAPPPGQPFCPRLRISGGLTESPSHTHACLNYERVSGRGKTRLRAKTLLPGFPEFQFTILGWFWIKNNWRAGQAFVLCFLCF
jgi:hypothetical protein